MTASAPPKASSSFDEVAQALAGAVQKLVADPARAVELLGRDPERRRDPAHRRSRASSGECWPKANRSHIRLLPTPACARRSCCNSMPPPTTRSSRKEWFGPISFVIATDSTAQSLDLAGSIAAEHGALTLSVYSTDDAVIEAAHEAAIRGGVALSINLTGGVFVNQSAAFSDFHGTGANPAANSRLPTQPSSRTASASFKAEFMLNRRRRRRQPAKRHRCPARSRVETIGRSGRMESGAGVAASIEGMRICTSRSETRRHHVRYRNSIRHRYRRRAARRHADAEPPGQAQQLHARDARGIERRARSRSKQPARARS